jgi:hypothetical protein
MSDRKPQEFDSKLIAGLPPWLFGLAIMVALFVVYRVAELNGYLLTLPEWSSECAACG